MHAFDTGRATGQGRSNSSVLLEVGTFAIVFILETTIFTMPILAYSCTSNHFYYGGSYYGNPPAYKPGNRGTDYVGSVTLNSGHVAGYASVGFSPSYWLQSGWYYGTTTCGTYNSHRKYYELSLPGGYTCTDLGGTTVGNNHAVQFMNVMVIPGPPPSFEWKIWYEGVLVWDGWLPYGSGIPTQMLESIETTTSSCNSGYTEVYNLQYDQSGSWYPWDHYTTYCDPPYYTEVKSPSDFVDRGPITSSCPGPG